MKQRTGADKRAQSGTPSPSFDCRTCTLRQQHAFHPLSDREVEFIVQMRRGELRVATGMRAPLDPRSIYTVLEGWAARCRMLNDGARQIVDFLAPGDLIGLSRALYSAPTTPIVALTALTLCELDGSQLPALIKRTPELALQLLRTQAAELERADTRITLLGRMGAGQRVGYLLLELRERIRRRGLGDGRTLPFTLQRTDLADAVGLSKVHVMRALRELRERGLTRIERRRIVIADVRKLARFCGYTRTAVARCAIL